MDPKCSWSDRLFLSGSKANTMGKRITLLRARMSYKRRDRAQVWDPESCVHLWMVKKTPDKQEQNCFELHAASWKSSCQWTCHTHNSRTPWKDCWQTLFWCFHPPIWHALFNCVKIMPNWKMVIVFAMFLILIVDVLCLALFIAFLCGWGTVAFYGELSE